MTSIRYNPSSTSWDNHLPAELHSTLGLTTFAREALYVHLTENISIARAFGLSLSRTEPEITAVALVGSRARGSPYPADADFLIVLDTCTDFKGLEQRLLERAQAWGACTFIYYSPDQLEQFCRQSPERKFLMRHFRFATRVLRRYPEVKRLLAAVLGRSRTRLQMGEVLPQSFQTAIIISDEGEHITRCQEIQARLLKLKMSDIQRIFYQPLGFYHTLLAYLQGDLELGMFSEVLWNSDIEAAAYLQRCIEFFHSQHSHVDAQNCEALLNTGISE